MSCHVAAWRNLAYQFNDMSLLETIFGSGKDLDALQMSCRGIAVFIIALALLRISGRRSFGMRTPLDNIIVILLGAVLSRAVVGASPFLPVVCSCLFIVIMHRLLAWITVRNKRFSSAIQGDRILLFEHGQFNHDNMSRALVSEKDLHQAVRKKAATEDMEKIERMYMEPAGEISVIKK